MMTRVKNVHLSRHGKERKKGEKTKEERNMWMKYGCWAVLYIKL